MVGWVAEIGELRIVFGRGVTWRITGGVSAFGVLEEANGLVRGYRWVREHDEGRQAGSRVGVGDWEQNSQESRARADRRLWAKASRGIRQWREGGSWTSLMRVSARSTPTGRHSGGAGGGGRQVVEIRYTSIQSHWFPTPIVWLGSGTRLAVDASGRRATRKRRGR